MSTQRKIHHVLASEGEGKSFRYLPVLKAPLDLSRPILVTEKVDGSTMQSQLGEPWKRFDRFSKGDPRKRLVSEDERYELRRCEAVDPAMKWYLAAFEAFRHQFEKFGELFPDTWVYFEALGGKIGSRHPGLEPTIRAFDVSRDGKFLPFGMMREMTIKASLPRVDGWHRSWAGSLDRLLEDLGQDQWKDRGLAPPYKLEGWVLRQDDGNGNEVVAKIRVADLQKIVR